jgi:hypothetical protein
LTSEEQENVLFVDLEWMRNTDEGPGMIGIGLRDGSVHPFHVPMIGGIPDGIKTLMEEPTIQSGQSIPLQYQNVQRGQHQHFKCC